MRLIQETVAKLGIAGELIVFLWKRKLWWLIPMVAVLLAFGIVIVVGGSTGAGPFVYTLF
jgi:presenilin-like A22 family membrane protease